MCEKRSNSSSCEGVTYSTGSVQYDQVCGRIIGYQYGIPYVFNGPRSIDSPYVDGVSVTHGSPRQHIWTFAGGFDEQLHPYPGNVVTCPCVSGSTAENRIPSFVGQNYFCESGLTQWRGPHGILWPNGDPLWDGQGLVPVAPLTHHHGSM